MRVLTSPPAERPIDVIQQAVSWCERRGISIRLGDYGIVNNGRSGWWIKPNAPGVCPLGAVVLWRQPAIVTLPEAPAVALGVPISWVEGYTDGADKSTPSRHWLGAPDRQQYLDGYQFGSWTRMQILTKPCLVHNLRHRRDEPCSACLRGLS